MTSRKPVHTRDKDGRHRIDLRQLPPFPRFALAVAVVVFVLGLVVRDQSAKPGDRSTTPG